VPVRKVDPRRQLKHHYNCLASNPETVDVPEFEYIALNRKGDPNWPESADAVSCLDGLSYAIKFAAKKRLGLDYNVPLSKLGTILRQPFEKQC